MTLRTRSNSSHQRRVFSSDRRSVSTRVMSSCCRHRRIRLRLLQIPSVPPCASLCSSSTLELSTGNSMTTGSLFKAQSVSFGSGEPEASADAGETSRNGKKLIGGDADVDAPWRAGESSFGGHRSYLPCSVLSAGFRPPRSSNAIAYASRYVITKKRMNVVSIASAGAARTPSATRVQRDCESLSQLSRMR